MQKKQEKQNKDLTNSNNNVWTFGYPTCINKKQSRLVCLHKNCQKYPFFCSTCQDQSCELQHKHQDRITSIGFKELIRKLISERKVPQPMVNSIDNYKKTLQELRQNVTKFVEIQIKAADQILRKELELQPEEEEVIVKMKEKRFSEVKGRELDRVWRKVSPTQQSKKRQKETIQFVDSKRVEVQQLNQHFLGMLGEENGINNDKDKNQSDIPLKSQIKMK